MDIRKFFSPTNGTAKKIVDQKFTNITKKSEGKNTSKLSKKRRIAVIESDSDEEPLPSKKCSVENLSTKKSPVKSKPNLSVLHKIKVEKKPLKPVLSKDFFNSSKPDLKIDNITCVDIGDDEDFEETLKQLDKKKVTKLPDDILIEEITSSASPTVQIDDNSNSFIKVESETKVTKCKEKTTKETKGKSKSRESKKSDNNKDDLPRAEVKVKESLNSNGTNDSVNVKSKIDIVESKKPTKGKKRKSDDEEIFDKKESPPKQKEETEASNAPTRRVEHSESQKEILDLDVTSKEKLSQNPANYRNYLNRQGPQALGTKEIPEGEENCLHGLTFLVTGVLESLERDEVKDIALKYGGKVMTTLSKNTSYMIVGRDAGPAKLDKAEKLGTKFLNEDEFLDLIRTRPGKKGTKAGNVGNKQSLNRSLKESSPKVKEKVSVLTPEKVFANSESSSGVSSMSSKNSISPKQKESYCVASSSGVSSLSSDGSLTVRKGVGSSACTEMSLMWVDKYKPVSLKQVIGQQGDRSCAKKLLNWMNNWQKNHSGDKKKPQGKWTGKEDGSIFKAALLSGPPGVGKTTTATLACKEAGFEFIELNASDTRSKKCLQSEISEVLQNQTISGSFSSFQVSQKLTQKHAIIFDEVDGMSGNEDRGGTQELISLIKHSKIPVICICNDRAHPKIRSLSNYCFDLRFFRPRVEQIKAGMMSLLHKEKVKVPPETLHEIITASNQDLRQVLHHLSFLSSKSVESKEFKTATKDIKLSPFDVLKSVFSTDTAKSSLNDKSSLFFHDYSLAPLFVFENYPAVKPASAKGNANKHLELLSEAADSISYGDIIDRVIRSQNNWSLLPTQAMFSSVFPGESMRGYLSQMIAFPSWLGKNSSKNHMDRVLQQIHMHTRLKISANKTELGIEYLPQLKRKLTQPLIDSGAEGVKEVLETMEGYYLQREDLDTVVELTLWPPQKDPMTMIEPKVKAALTRSFNKESFKNPYATINFKKGKKRSAGTSFDDDLGEDGEEEIESEEEDSSADAMVKQKKSAKVSKEIEIASSKGKGRGKSTGRGRGKTAKCV